MHYGAFVMGHVSWDMCREACGIYQAMAGCVIQQHYLAIATNCKVQDRTKGEKLVYQEQQLPHAGCGLHSLLCPPSQ